MSLNHIIESIKNDMEYNAVTKISNNEIDDIILKMGTLLTITKNKKINQTKLFIAVIRSEPFKQIFMQLTDIENFHTLIKLLINRYPNVCKSKNLFIAIKRKKKC